MYRDIENPSSGEGAGALTVGVIWIVVQFAMIE